MLLFWRGEASLPNGTVSDITIMHNMFNQIVEEQNSVYKKNKQKIVLSTH